MTARRVTEPQPAWLPGGDLLGLKVWPALVIKEHAHHAQAHRYWGQEQPFGGTRLFCRVTLLGLVRMLCRSDLMGAAAMTLDQAHALCTAGRAAMATLTSCPIGTAPDKLLAAWPAVATLDRRLAGCLGRSRRLVLGDFRSGFARFPLTRSPLLRAS